MPASVRTLSQLPTVDANSLKNEARLEVAVPVSVGLESSNVVYRYASRAILAGSLSEKISNDVYAGLHSKNGLLSDLRLDDLCATVLSIATNDFKFDGQKTFASDPLIDNSPLSDFSLNDSSLADYSVNYDTLQKFTAIHSTPTIGPNFGFVTRLSNDQSDASAQERIVNIFNPAESDGEWELNSTPYFVMDQDIKSITPNEYVFKIEPGERTSKSWKSPASGIFTCYGWLDEINNPSQSNETRWVALLGKERLLGERGWSILQVQPFIKNNYLSYVGFTFPVKKGMELKVMTGFPVGSNSDKYFAANTSLANHVANAFMGGVYTGLSGYAGPDEEEETTTAAASSRSVNPDNDYVTSSELKNSMKEIFEQLADLQQRLEILQASANNN